MTDPGSIRALALQDFEKPPMVIDVREPVPGPGEVQVRMRAASINYWDAFIATGMARDFMTYEFPVVLGMDVAGTVKSVGDDVEGLAIGDRVFGTMGAKDSVHDGSFGEVATPQAASLAVTPPGLDDQVAGTLGVAATTAMSAVEAVAPNADSTVLVLGATGGVGSFAIQLAAARGAHVIATARHGDEDFVGSLGAAETVDYTGDLATAVRQRHPDGVDGLLDLVNRDAAVFRSMVELIRPGGHATSILGGAGDAAEMGKVAVSNTGGDPKHLSTVADMVVAGTLRAAIRRTYALADGPQALEEFLNQHTLGKLVITMS